MGIKNNCLETLAVIEGLELDSDPLTEEEVAKKFGWEEDFLNGRLSRWQRIKPKIWLVYARAITDPPITIAHLLGQYSTSRGPAAQPGFVRLLCTVCTLLLTQLLVCCDVKTNLFF